MASTEPLVMSYVNNGFREPITTDTLAACLRDASLAPHFRDHLASLFLEVPISRIDSFAVAQAITYAELLCVWRWFSAHGRETRPELDHWLSEMAT
ncbi:MAG: hypothetical protein IV100_16950 [Myxococcales bacterium]|nr:hypothetical protein [Myxococcales bacterium]